MSEFFDAKLFGEAFITLFVIIDPPGIIPVFLGLTRGYPENQRTRLAWQAPAVAFAVIVVFAVFGQTLLNYLGVSVPALMLAGGLLLLLVALELLTGKATSPNEPTRSNVNVAMVPLGTPLLAGPGAIVATIVFVQRADHVNQIVALALAIVAVHLILWLVMRFSLGIMKVIKENGVELVTRIAGLLLAAIAVQLCADAVRDFIQAG
ncbi:MarC family protein [Actinomadura sp. HBU206391]|uniref:MarC family protein n=1 Tax=Actinomadura sp. HBU206391 TaxID=2731692 RepID=UPI00164FE722|nr:MarC family protein [Actinomadura sp. HBU206391]MBC6463366.1 MarC family protein [Actinomadura sp. HBU206391]